MSLFDSTTRTVRQLKIRLERRLRNIGKTRRAGRHRRRLHTELLETRQLLAADLGPSQHNVFLPEDVNDDGIVSAVDALMVVNSINDVPATDDLSFIDVSNDGIRSPLDALLVINRLNRDNQLRRDQMRGRDPLRDDPATDTIPDMPAEIRSIDGTGNNLDDNALGAAGTQLLRIAEADYGDGISSTAGEDRPSPREISNLLSDVADEDRRNARGLSAFIYVWGQFLDHDIDLTMSQTDGESFDISVPADDVLFDPTGTGEETIPLTRSEYDASTGTSTENPRQQISSVTAYVDGSMIYGSDQATADSLRAFTRGLLLISDDGLLPTDEAGHVLAGDIRAAENIALTALHALFVREHNRLATEIASEDPTLSDEEVYQQARAIVVAEIQSITYNEFLPALLGNRTLTRYRGYDTSVNPSIANEFSTAAFRFGHSTLNDEIEFFDNEGRSTRDGISLAEAFFNPGILEDTGIDTLLKYEASTQAQEVDLGVVDSLRNFLFGVPGSGGLDLAALNIQRGRDHGLNDYNTTRIAYGLDPVNSFAEITADTDLQAKLELLYGDVNNIDLWVGLLAEDHMRGSSLGELNQAIISDQFERLRDGDRHWYENVFSGSDLRQLQQTTLADVIERNTDVEGLQDNVFFMLAEVSGQVTVAPPVETDFQTRRNRTRNDRSAQPVGIAGITVELLNDNGVVIDTAVTDRRGNYRFRSTSFAETGDYQIRVPELENTLASASEAIDILISNGATRLRNLDFQVALA
ncbi:MAG: peroxidase family protein [Pirellulaceae bacterium]